MSDESTSGDDPDQPVPRSRGQASTSSRGLWSAEEDALLVNLIQKLGTKNWSVIARGIAGRTGKSCRLRWYNQLSPELKRGPFEAEEDRTIILAHAEFGNQWSRMAKLLPGRTDNAIKNRWHSALKRTVSEGLPLGGAADLPPVRVGQHQLGHLAGQYFGKAQPQASADSPAWRTDTAVPDRQEAYVASLGYQERPGQHWRQRHSSEEPAGLGEDDGQGSGGRGAVMEHPPLEGLKQPRPGAIRFEVPPHGHAPGGGGGVAPARHGFSAEEVAAAQQDGMDLSLLPGVQMAAAQMRALMDNTARVARAEQASGHSLLSSADWDIAQDPSAARLMTPENLVAVRKWAAILSSAGEGMDWPTRAAAAEQQQQQQQAAGLTRPAAAAQLHLWQPAQHREVLQIPENSGWRPRRRMSEAPTDTDDALGRFAAAATRSRGALYGYLGEPEFSGGGKNMWQASQQAAAAMQEIEARKRARYTPAASFAEQGLGHRADAPPQGGPPPELAREQQTGLFEADRAQGHAAAFLQVAAERARHEGFPQQHAGPAGLSLAALHAAAANKQQQQQQQQHGAGVSGELPSRLDRIDSMPLLPSAVHRQGPFERPDLSATLSAEPLLTGLNSPWAPARGMGRATAAGQDGASRDGLSPAISPSAAPTSSDPVQGPDRPFQSAFRERDTETSLAISE